MIHNTKIGIVIKDGLLEWQTLNVTAFLASGIAASAPECIGQPYEDGSGNKYISLFGQPVFVYIASAEHLQRTRARALSRDVAVAIYSRAMFTTDNDVDNRATVKAVASEDLNLVGLALRADSKTFDKIINGLKLHP